MNARRPLLPMILALLMLMTADPGSAQSTGQAPSVQRSAGQAMALGLATVAVPAGIGLLAADEGSVGIWGPLLLTSWILGPAPGLFYARDSESAWDGMGFRTLTLAAAVGGVAVMAANFDLFDDSNDGGFAAGAVVGMAAAGLTAWSWIHDLGKIPPAVERLNAGMQTTPVLTRDGGIGAQLTYRW